MKKNVWMIRSGDEELAELVWERQALAIGWDLGGDLSKVSSRELMKERYIEAYPDHSQGTVNVNTGQIFRFINKISREDFLLTYLKNTREVLIGIATEDYEYNPDIFQDLPYNHIRHLKWLKKVSRDDFSPKAKNSMGSTLTVFKLSDYIPEIEALISKEKIIPLEETEDDSPSFVEDVKSTAELLIIDMLSDLDPFDYQDLVAALLRSMGYRAISTKPGPDQGVDIVAYPDALGFEKPSIKAQVKRRSQQVSGPEMREFIGTLREGDNGLYVSSSGYTKSAKIEARNSQNPLTILDNESFMELILEYYEALEPEFKTLLPLKRVWIPYQKE